MSSAPLPQLTGGRAATGATAGGDPQDVGNRLIRAIGGVVLGAEHTIGLVVSALLSGGHVLVEDLPGTGKTTLAKAVARAAGGSFARVQGTPDLMPADVTGSGVWDDALGALRFVPGPVFANVLLMDELNRAAPRTQSALMEALDESAVTADGIRHQLPDPFLVIGPRTPSTSTARSRCPRVSSTGSRCGSGRVSWTCTPRCPSSASSSPAPPSTRSPPS